MIRLVRVLAITTVILALCGGCTPLERTAYNMAVASKAFLNSVQSKHPECAAPTFPVGSGTLCLDLEKAVAAQHLLIDAIEGYCNLSALPATDTTACAPAPKGTPALTQFTNALNQAIAGYEQAETDLKGIVQ